MALSRPDNLKGAGTQGNGSPRTVVVQIAKTNTARRDGHYARSISTGGT